MIIAERLIEEIKNRVQFLDDVGLGYLTLNRHLLPFQEENHNV